MKHTKGEKIFQVVNIFIMLLVCVITLYPYLNQVAVSFNEGMDAMLGGITVFPRKFTLANYAAVFNNRSIINGAYVSVSKTLIHTVLGLTVLFMSAYGITRSNLPYRKGITLFLMIPCYVGAGQIPT